MNRYNPQTGVVRVEGGKNLPGILPMSRTQKQSVDAAATAAAQSAHPSCCSSSSSAVLCTLLLQQQPRGATFAARAQTS